MQCGRLVKRDRSDTKVILAHIPYGREYPRGPSVLLSSHLELTHEMILERTLPITADGTALLTLRAH